jgi:multiple sugar transport system permease protein
MSKGGTPVKILTWCAIVAITLFFFFPIIWEFLTSFKTAQEVTNPRPSILFQPSVENWVSILERGILKNLKNSVVISTASTFFSVLVGVLAAYPLATINFKRRKMLAFEIIMLRMLPPVAVIVPIFLLWQKAHLLDTYFGLIILYVTFNLPFSCWLLIQYFRGIPTEILEAALVDGSSWSKNLFRIVLPLAKSGVVAVAIFCMIFSWSEFLFALILTDEKTLTLPVAASGVMRLHLMDWGALSSAASLIMILPLLFIFFVQRHFVRGLTFGAMK